MTQFMPRHLGMSWTQMGKSSMPAEPLHMRAHMCSQEFSDTESTTTLLGESGGK